MERSIGSGPRCGFTLVELLVVIAIIMILAGLLMPALERARQLAQETTCKGNLHQQGLAFALYNNDWDGYNPPPYLWKERLVPYVSTTEAFRCPSRLELPWYYGHGYNVGCPAWELDKAAHPDLDPVAGMAGRPITAVPCPGHKILTVEWDRCLAGPPVGKKGLFRGGVLCYWAVCRVHLGGSNILFGEGRVTHAVPDDYHSSTQYADESGNPVPSAPDVVGEEVWRRYWDAAHVP